MGLTTHCDLGTEGTSVHRHDSQMLKRFYDAQKLAIMEWDEEAPISFDQQLHLSYDSEAGAAECAERLQ